MGRNTDGRGPGGLIASFQKHYDELLGYLVHRTGDREKAADVVQDTYLKLVKIERDESEILNPRAYIYRVAGNLAIDASRRAASSGGLYDAEPPSENIPDNLPSPEQTAIDRDRLRLFDNALETLPSKARIALLLFRVDGLSHAEIARRLEVSESMVAKYLAQALKHCRDYMWTRES
ncbi:MAG: RNA polymerase sigma factor [Asticcacaulis sp.]